MKIEFQEVPFEEIRAALIENIRGYSSPVDSYYEDHVMESVHYRVRCAGQTAGFASIFLDSMLTQFSLEEQYKPHSVDFFRSLLEQFPLREAYVSTSDPFFLACALDHQKSVLVQDWVFQVSAHLAPTVAGFSLTPASLEDQEMIRQHDEGFFQNLGENLQNGQIYLGKMENQLVSFGIIEKSKLLSDQASLGMFVIRDQRGRHFGAWTIRELMRLCQSQRIVPVAGCFAANEFSRNALIRAGMVSNARLLKVKFADS